MPRPILSTTGKLPSRILELEALAMTGKGPSTLRLIHGQANDTAAIGEQRSLGNLLDVPSGTDYEPQTTANETLQTLSNNAADDVAGTGARTIRVVYVDENFQEQVVDVDLDGLTPVTIATDILNVNSALTIDAGTGSTPAGQIRVETTGNVERYRAANVEATRLKYCTPVGHTSFLRNFSIAAGSDVAGSADDDPAALVDIFTYVPLTAGDPTSWVRLQKISRAMTVDHRDGGGDDAMEDSIYSVMIPEGTLITGRLINRTTQQIRYYAYWTILQVPNELL